MLLRKNTYTSYVYIYIYVWLEGDREEENERREAWVSVVEVHDI